MSVIDAATPSAAYENRRGRLEAYFDRTARDAWIQLTSDAPVSGVRATVRAGRDRMRATLMDWLPRDMTGLTLLDAGCGTGALAVAAARRGARVIGVDVSSGLIDIARERTPQDIPASQLEFRVGDMLDPAFGDVDYVVAMDSLIHYPVEDITNALGALSGRARRAILFTFAPQTPALSLMHAAGKLFPRSDRAPAIEPVSEARLRRSLQSAQPLQTFTAARDARVANGFYVSHAMELARG
jgi:magnesium-protoporphyrin O-methyltransferase